jgi:lysylphosphatidylglycerol synthetase-like protein (DUF2156 family)
VRDVPRSPLREGWSVPLCNGAAKCAHRASSSGKGAHTRSPSPDCSPFATLRAEERGRPTTQRPASACPGATKPQRPAVVDHNLVMSPLQGLRWVAALLLAVLVAVAFLAALLWVVAVVALLVAAIWLARQLMPGSHLRVALTRGRLGEQSQPAPDQVLDMSVCPGCGHASLERRGPCPTCGVPRA